MLSVANRMEKDWLKKKAKNYALQVVVIELLLFGGIRLLGTEIMQIPSLFGVLFTFVFYIADGWIWLWVASHHEDYLPSFFTGTSVVRFLAALVFIGGCFLIGDHSRLVTFLLVFFLYYLIMLIHHGIYFMKVSNRL